MNPIKFSDYKQRITDTIQARLQVAPIAGENGFTLVEGFIMQPLSNEVSGNIVIGGPTIPLVAIVGNTSGRMYYFALKALNISGLEI
ncbi:MAG TPA: hypothetical protein VJB37_00250 [Patescibacteria group bacterium]|nr:hypothetical protein [Patescibacteria group bacterium]